MVKAILFDLGSTVWDDYPAELYQWSVLARLLSNFGIQVTHEEIIAKAYEIIPTYSPSLTRAIAWQYVNGDREAYFALIAELVKELKSKLSDPVEFKRLNPLFPGIPELLAELARDYPLAVVSQHYAEVERWMEDHEIGDYFKHVTVSGKEKLYKPDPRLFERCCQALDVAPQDVMMVGDRLDNDIWPANRLKMTTVRVLADPYRCQQPRYHTDMPDYTIEYTTDLPEVLRTQQRT